MVEIYNEFKKDKKLWDLGNERELALIREESLKMEYEDRVAKGIKEGIAQGIEERIQQGIKQGMKQGLEQGIEIGKNEILEKNKEICAKVLKKRYQIDCAQWIAGLNEKQLELIFEYIYDENDFEHLKHRIEIF